MRHAAIQLVTSGMPLYWHNVAVPQQQLACCSLWLRRNKPNGDSHEAGWFSVPQALHLSRYT